MVWACPVFYGNSDWRGGDVMTKTTNALIERAAKCVPTNWCDDLLTGSNSIGEPPWDCRHIEKLLLGVRKRIRELKVKHAKR